MRPARPARALGALACLLCLRKARGFPEHIPPRVLSAAEFSLGARELAFGYAVAAAGPLTLVGQYAGNTQSAQDAFPPVAFLYSAARPAVALRVPMADVDEGFSTDPGAPDLGAAHAAASAVAAAPLDESRHLLVVGCAPIRGRSEVEGSAFVFVHDAAAPRKVALVTRLRAGDSRPGDRFGGAVATNGRHVAVSAHAHDDMDHFGAVYVFEAQRRAPKADSNAEAPAVELLQIHKLVAPDAPSEGADAPESGFGAFERFGYSIAMSDAVLVVGAPPAAYVFDATSFSLLSRLCAPAGGVANNGCDTTSRLLFGLSVAVDGDIIAVGAPSTVDDLYLTGLFRTPNDALSGEVYLYRRGAGVTQPFKVLRPARNARNARHFGASVAVAPRGLVAVGSYAEDALPTEEDAFGRGKGPADAVAEGCVYAFQVEAAGEGQQKARPARICGREGHREGYYGFALAAAEDRIAVGAFNDDREVERGYLGPGTGLVYHFDLREAPEGGAATVAVKAAVLAAAAAALFAILRAFGATRKRR